MNEYVIARATQGPADYLETYAGNVLLSRMARALFRHTCKNGGLSAGGKWIDSMASFQNNGKLKLLIIVGIQAIVQACVG